MSAPHGALGQEALSFAGTVARLPRRLDALADRIEEGLLVATSPRLEQRMAKLERTNRRITSAVLFVGLFIGGILLRVDEPVWGVTLMVASVVPLLHAVFGGLFGRRGPG